MVSDIDKIKKGQTLSGIAAGIIVFILSGGQIQETGNLLGTSILISRPLVIELSILLLLLYIAYRYKLSRPTPYSDFEDKMRINVTDSKRFRTLVEKTKKLYFDQNKYDELERNLKKPIKAVKWKFNKGQAGVFKKSTKLYVKYIIDAGGYDTKEEEVELQRADFWRYGFQTVFYTEDFWIIILPWIVFWAAIVLIFIRILGYL
jgi:hypothetical protein